MKRNNILWVCIGVCIGIMIIFFTSRQVTETLSTRGERAMPNVNNQLSSTKGQFEEKNKKIQEKSDLDTEANVPNVLEESAPDVTVIEKVNNALFQLKDKESYQKANNQTKKEMLSEVLDTLSDQGLIQGCYYDEMNKFFSFQYQNGILGGVSIEKEYETVDGLYMN